MRKATLKALKRQAKNLMSTVKLGRSPGSFTKKRPLQRCGSMDPRRDGKM
jgi:hypothetical protein